MEKQRKKQGRPTLKKQIEMDAEDPTRKITFSVCVPRPVHLRLKRYKTQRGFSNISQALVHIIQEYLDEHIVEEETFNHDLQSLAVRILRLEKQMDQLVTSDAPPTPNTSEPPSLALTITHEELASLPLPDLFTLGYQHGVSGLTKEEVIDKLGRCDEVTIVTSDKVETVVKTTASARCAHCKGFHKGPCKMR